MKELVEKTLYFINTIDGVDGPPYAHTVTNVKGTSMKVEENHSDESGTPIHARAISKEEFDAYWDEQEKLKEKQAKAIAKARKEDEERILKLKDSVTKKLVLGEKLTEEEAQFVAGNLGL